MTTATASKIHPLANLFPTITPDEYEGLKESIRTVGQLEPIWMLEGQVIDGRARFRACIELGIKPYIKQHSGNDIAGFVCAQNLHRRHLTAAQRAVLATELLSYETAEAEARMVGGTRVPERDRGRAVTRAARRVGAGKNAVSDLKRIQREHPKLFDEVKNGPLTVQDAVMLSKVDDIDQDAAIDLVKDRSARSAREALELVFAARGETVPARLVQRPHRDVLIDELRRVLEDAVAKADAGDAQAAIADLRRAFELSRQV